MSKAAVAQLVKSTAIDYAKYNILINAICPGTVDTPMLDNLINYATAKGIDRNELIESLKNDQPVKGLITTDEVARFVDFLLREDNKSITGSLHSIDGGITA